MVAEAVLALNGEILIVEEMGRELATKYEDMLQLRGGWTHNK